MRCLLTLQNSTPRLFAAASLGLALFAVPASAQAPCADMRGLLDAFARPKGGGNVMYIGGYGAFFPKDSHYTGKAIDRDQFRCHMVLDRGGKEVGRWPMLVQDAGLVFQRFQPYGSSPVYSLDGAGSFVLGIELDGEDVTSTPFEVTATASSDPFNPTTSYSVDSPLLSWAQLSVAQRSSSPGVSVDLRLRGKDLDLVSGAELLLTIERQGRVVYTGGRFGKTALGDGSEWRKFSKELRYPDQKGGGFLPFDDFAKVDGVYRVVLRSGGKAVRAFEYTIAGGAIKPHERSSFQTAPRTDYLLSRVCLPDSKGTEDLYWLEPLADPNAGAEAAPTAAPISAATRSAWKPVPALPARAASVVVTDIAARVDAHIAAGDGVVAFGTGPNTGVSLVRCDEGTEVSIPGGSEFSAKAFFFCGKKLVLLKKSLVSIYDTETGSMTDIPAEDVTLERAPFDSMKGRHIDVDGNLVAVICDPKKVSDRKVVKVIDLSGSAPRIIDLGFPEATPAELVSIAVDAAGGVVAVGSDRKKALFVAPIAEDANFRSLDLSGHDGLTKDCAPIVRNGKAAIFDATGTRKLRLVDLESGSVKTLCGLAKALRWFDYDGERVALASDVSYGSSYEIRSGAAGSQPKAPAGAGESVKHGKAGYAQVVALAPEGLLFASGYGKSGISKDEVLLVGQNGGALGPIMAGELALPAVDATLGTGVLAFKTGKSRDARVGFILLGKGMKAADLRVDG